MARKKPVLPRCQECGAEMERDPRARYCSAPCRNRAYRRRVALDLALLRKIVKGQEVWVDPDSLPRRRTREPKAKRGE